MMPAIDFACQFAAMEANQASLQQQILDQQELIQAALSLAPKAAGLVYMGEGQTLDKANALSKIKERNQKREEQAYLKLNKAKIPKPTKTTTPKCVLPCVFDAHGIKWMHGKPVENINNFVTKQEWWMKTTTRERTLRKNSNLAIKHNLDWYFIQAFPIKYLKVIIVETNKQLMVRHKNIEDRRGNDHPTTEQEIVKFFGIILLIPHLPNMPRRNLWKTVAPTKYSAIGTLSLVGMSRDRFEVLGHPAKNQKIVIFA